MYGRNLANEEDKLWSDLLLITLKIWKMTELALSSHLREALVGKLNTSYRGCSHLLSMNTASTNRYGVLRTLFRVELWRFANYCKFG